MNRPVRNRAAATTAVLISSISLAGCATMAPRYERPALPVSETYPSDPATGTNTSAATADIGWKSFYADPLLQELLDKAIANNRDFRIAALNVEAARARYRIQRSSLLPRLGVGAEANLQELPDDLFFNSRSYQVGATVPAWEVDLWGRIRSLNDQALQQYLALDETRIAAQLGLVAEVASAYLTFRSDQAMLALARQTLASQQRSLDLTRQRAEVGVATLLDLRRAEEALRGTEADVASMERLVAQGRNALTLLLGAPLEPALAQALDRPDAIPDTALPLDVPAGLPSELLVRRPDIRAAEHRLRGANASIGAARAAFFPTITLTGSAGTASSRLEDLFSQGSGAWSFLPRISLPIFQGGALRAGLDEAEVRKRIEVASYEKAIQSAFREVADGLAARPSFEAELRAGTQRVQASEAAYRLAEQRFREGEDDNLVLLEAQRRHYQAEQALIRARLARMLNLIDLYKALGGGWTDTDRSGAG